MIDNQDYTPKGDRAEQKVRRDLETIVNEFRSVVDGTYILTGSFGRGEGSVQKTNTGLQPVNDYDFVVIPETNSQELEGLLTSKADKIAKELSIDFVDVMTLNRTELETLEPSIFNYDLRYGSVVIHGETDILQEIPDFSPEDIPLYEAVILLSNRMAGLLGGLVKERSNRYLQNQIQKLRLAWADSLLLTQSTYHSSYSKKVDRCKSLLAESQLNKIPENTAIKKGIDDAISFKLNPEYRNEMSKQEIEDCLRRTHHVFQAVNESLMRTEFNSPWESYNKLASYELEPHVRVWNAYRMWRSNLIGPFKTLRLLPFASESQIRVSIILALHRMVTGRMPMDPILFYRELFSGETLNPSEGGEKLYGIWNSLFH